MVIDIGGRGMGAGRRHCPCLGSLASEGGAGRGVMILSIGSEEATT